MADTKMLCNVCLNYYDPSEMAKEKGIPRCYCKDCKTNLTKFYTVRSAIRRALRIYAKMSEADILRILEKEKEQFYERRRTKKVNK